MTRDDIIRWARSAIRLSADDASLMGFDQEATILDRYEFLHWFAKEAAAAEREACAQAARTAMLGARTPVLGAEWVLAGLVQKAIRARGKE